MRSIKVEGRPLRSKCESAIPTSRKTTRMPEQSPKKPCRLNKTSSEIPTLSVGRKRFRKVHNCLPPESPISTPVPKIAKTNLKRKSVSLVELSFITKVQTPKKWLSKEHGDEIKFPSSPEVKETIPQFKSSREFELAKKVYKTFILRAWRRSRSQVRELQNLNQRLLNEVGNLQLQTNVLRNLLESEQLRVAVANGDSAHLRHLLERQLETAKENTERLDRLEAEKVAWEESRSEMASKLQLLGENLDFESAKVRELNDKCKVYQRDLAMITDNERNLQDKLLMAESELKYKLSLVEGAEKKCAELTSAKNILMKQNENKQGEINELLEKIKNKDQQLSSLQQLRKVLEGHVETLSKELVTKSKEIERKDSAIKTLEKSIILFECEQEEFQQNLKRVRNKVVFEAIKISASLLLPKPSYTSF